MRKYVSFAPTDAGFVNVLMNLEVALSISEITNRTLILPPDFWFFYASKKFNKENFIDIFNYINKDYLYSNFNCIDLYDVPELDGLFSKIEQKETDCPIRGKRPYSYTGNIQKYISNIKNIDMGKDVVVSGSPYVFYSGTIEDYSDFSKFSGKRTKFSLDFEEQFLHFERNLYGLYWYSVYPGGPLKRNRLKNKVNSSLMYKDKFAKMSEKVYNTIGPYNSIHVRRNDFLEDRSEYISDTSQSSKLSAIIKYLFKDNKPVYISTDEKDLTFFDDLSKYKTLYFLKDFYTDIDDKLSESILEQLICVNSDLFYGTYMSTYSKRINILRGYQNKQTSDGMGINNLYHPLCDYTDPLPWTKYNVYWNWESSSHPQWLNELV